MLDFTWLTDAVVWLLQGLRELFSTFSGYFVAKALGFLGVSLAANTFLLGPIMAQVLALIQGAGGGPWVGVAISWLGYIGLDQCITMLLSAHGMGAASESLRVFFKKVI